MRAGSTAPCARWTTARCKSSLCCLYPPLWTVQAARKVLLTIGQEEPAVPLRRLSAAGVVKSALCGDTVAQCGHTVMDEGTRGVWGTGDGV